MKRYVNMISRGNKIELEICAVLSTDASADQDVSANSSTSIEWRSQLKPEYQLTDAQFEAYVNFIKSAVSIIKKFGFDIVDEYQSNVSYSYYIQFTPEPYKGFEDQMLELDVKFRLSDHYSQSSTVSYEGVDYTSKGVIFDSFVVEGVKHDDIASTLLDIRNICKDLKVGDYSRLLKG